MNAPQEPLTLLRAAAAAGAALDAMFARAWSELAPPLPLTIAQWAETYRELSAEESAMPGKFDLDHTPALRGILACASNPNVRKIVTVKGAQVAYTSGVVCNVVAYHIHWRPSVQIVMFPREKSAKDFAAEKFEPMVRATPQLAERVNLKSRAAGNGTTRRHYDGGLLKLVASNSPSDVKSTSGRIGIVEEPDDTNRDVGGQGNAIALVGERTKTYAPDDLQLIGGTPTAKQTSLICKEMRSTDQREMLIPCPHCNERHALDFLANVTIPGLRLTDEELALPVDQLAQRWPEREVYGRARWEDAFYACPHCGSVWTDEARIQALRTVAREEPLHGWQPTAESSTPGFHLPELLSTFDGSRVPELARKYLVALHEFERGEPEKMVAFYNSTLALPWEYKGELPEEDELRDRAEHYAEWSVPAGGLVALLQVDVQHDRLACTVWVFGMGEEMWLAFWGELPGRTIVSRQGAWLELEGLLTRRVRHACGAMMPIAGVTVDSGDGQTSEAVYDFVRRHHTKARPVIATKGASDSVGRVEIWTRPKDIDPNRQATKASRAGVKVSTIGAAKAKDLILGWAQEGGRVRLAGSGPGRMHWYRGVRDDFFEQLLGEMKVPSRSNPRLRAWVERTDRRNEVLDCTVQAVWMSRQLRLHLRSLAEWRAIETRLRQASLPDIEDLPALPGQAPRPDSPPPPPVVPVVPVPLAPQPQPAVSAQSPLVSSSSGAAAARPTTNANDAPQPLGGGRISLGGSRRFGGHYGGGRP